MIVAILIDTISSEQLRSVLREVQLDDAIVTEKHSSDGSHPDLVLLFELTVATLKKIEELEKRLLLTPCVRSLHVDDQALTLDGQLLASRLRNYSPTDAGTPKIQRVPLATLHSKRAAQKHAAMPRKSMSASKPTLWSRFRRLVGQGRSEAPMPAVDFSLFAPSIITDRRCLVQVFLHDPHLGKGVETLAKARRPDAQRLGLVTLEAAIPLGATVSIEFSSVTWSVDDAVQFITWSGEPAAVDFFVNIPPGAATHEPVSAVVSVNDVVVGSLSCELIFQPHLKEADDHRDVVLMETNVGYSRQAFVSYSRRDFQMVSLFAEGLEQASIKLSMDITSLEPGDNWRNSIASLISTCDVFYLMWSDNAAVSSVVLSELECAVALSRNQRKPMIKPIVIHRPAPPAPQSIAHLHFNSNWLSRRMAEQSPLFHPR